MFSRFYRPPALGLPFCQALRKKAIQDLCRLKAEKRILYIYKKRGTDPSLHLFCSVPSAQPSIWNHAAVHLPKVSGKSHR